MNVLLRSPHLSTAPPQAFLSENGYDGLVDMAGNALDGNGDGRVTSPVEDSYTWNCGTTDRPILVAPIITNQSPLNGEESNTVSVDQEPSVTFDTALQASSVNNRSAQLLFREPGADASDTFWFQPIASSVAPQGAPANPMLSSLQGRIVLKHRVYKRVPEAQGVNQPIYYPSFHSGIQNMYQNCFVPAASQRCAATPSSPNCCDGTPQSAACGYPETTP
jgi:hypothetical protein